jgi:glycine/D-amino acid oxidase-like deaminating enzyme
MQTSTPMLTIVVLLAIVAVALIAVFAARSARKRRHDDLRHRFGPEYDHAVEAHQGNVPAAERELIARQKRISQRKLRTLSESDRAQFAADWRNVQARFVDDPPGAMQAADELIHAVMLARGYPNVRFDQRVADLSVEHGSVIEHYRAAHALAEANREGRADTEELRQAVVHYRALFADLLGQSPTPERKLQEAHV